MLRRSVRHSLSVSLAIAAILSGCVRPTVETPAVPPGAVTLLVRLGTDTLAMEQYTRTATRMEGVLVTRVPLATVNRYAIDLVNGAPAAAEYSLRRGDGALMPNSMQSLSVRYGTDSVTLVGHRQTGGDTTRANPVRGMPLPYVNGSYALYELALARLIGSGRDSADFAIVPLQFNVRNTAVLPMKLLGGDSVRIAYFGNPLYGRHDARGSFLWLDGRQTTIKVRVDRVASANLDSIARAWTLRDLAASTVAGPASPRDTARATLGAANVWIDYGRPALRGREVWINGVLGDTIWRTGANAATQLRTDRDLVIGGSVVPAGTYSLWTHTTENGYELIINRQAGQWGTEYHAERDLVRVPLAVTRMPTSTERFTIGIEPTTGNAGVLALMWGDRRLSVPVTAR